MKKAATANQTSGRVATAYLMSHHQSTKAMEVVQIEMRNAVAVSFAHSQYDTNFSSSRPLPHCMICRVGK